MYNIFMPDEENITQTQDSENIFSLSSPTEPIVQAREAAP